MNWFIFYNNDNDCIVTGDIYKKDFNYLQGHLDNGKFHLKTLK